MNSQSNQPCRRARLLSALKLSEKPPKDSGISYSNFKRAKAYEMAHPKPVVKPTLDQCDPLMIALERSVNTSTSNRYTSQRSTKIPLRVPASFPVNQNFSQRVIDNFDNTKDETDPEESNADEDGILDQFDPLLAALARSANNSTSRRYARQRSTKVPVRVPAGFPTNKNFSQRVIYTSGNVKHKTDVCESGANEDIILISKHHARNQHHKVSNGIDFPKVDLPESQSPLTPVRVSRKEEYTPPSKASTTLVTPRLTVSPCSATSSVGSPLGSSFTTPSPTSISSARAQFSTRSSLTAQRWSNRKPPKQINTLHTIYEGLLSPSRLPSPAPPMTHRQKSHAEIMAGLEFLNKFYGEI